MGESEIDEEEAAFAATGFATEEELKHLNGRVQVAATDEEKSNYDKKGRLISPADAENDNESKTETLKKQMEENWEKLKVEEKAAVNSMGLPPPPKGGGMVKNQPKPPPRLKTTPKGVVLPDANYVPPEVANSSEDDDDD